MILITVSLSHQYSFFPSLGYLQSPEYAHLFQAFMPLQVLFSLPGMFGRLSFIALYNFSWNIFFLRGLCWPPSHKLITSSFVPLLYIELTNIVPLFFYSVLQLFIYISVLPNIQGEYYCISKQTTDAKYSINYCINKCWVNEYVNGWVF